MSKLVLPSNEEEYKRDCQMMYEKGRADAYKEIAYSNDVKKEEFEILAYNQALEDISEKIKWQYKNYKSMPSIYLFLEIVEQLKK